MNDVRAAAADRAAEEPFEDPPLLWRFRRGERVASVEMRIANTRFVLGVVFLRARLRQDLDAPASRPRVLGRIRILVDADLLDADALTFSALTSIH
jgi:hypothetical protein